MLAMSCGVAVILATLGFARMGHAAERVEAKLRKIYDGDTLLVEIKGEAHPVRFAGIDAPEIVADSKEKDNNPLAFGLDFSRRMKQALRQEAYEARKFLRQCLKDADHVLLEITGEQRGRLVGYAFRPGEKQPLGLALVRAGLARVYTGRFDFDREEAYVRAQVEAMAGRSGLWELLNERKTDVDFFIGVHADARGRERSNLNDEYVVIGNVDDKERELGGHLVVDEANHDFQIPPDTVLKPGACITVRTGGGEDMEGTFYQHRGDAIWNNDGDTVYLLDPEGSEIARLTYAP
jgi:endonuclease YncB( thermonuclease family)